MNNVHIEVDGDTMTITVDLSKSYGLSASKKSLTVATTAGNTRVSNSAGEAISVGLNVYKKA